MRKGKIKCPYCTDIAEEKEYIYVDMLGSIEIQDNYLSVTSYNNNSTIVERKIKYCPMCGKKLINKKVGVAIYE